MKGSCSSGCGFYKRKRLPKISKMPVIRHLRRKSWLQQQSCAKLGASSSPRKLRSHLPAQTAVAVTRQWAPMDSGPRLFACWVCLFFSIALPPNPFSALLCLALGLGRLVTWPALPSTSCCGPAMGICRSLAVDALSLLFPVLAPWR